MIYIKNEQNRVLVINYFMIPSTFLNYKKQTHKKLIIYFRKFVYEHNINGPAHIIYGMIKYEYKLHEIWMLNGKKHRNNKPSGFSCNPLQVCVKYHKLGELHNPNEPAIIYWKKENKKIELQYWHHGYLVKQAWMDFDPVELNPQASQSHQYYHPLKILDKVKSLFNI